MNQNNFMARKKKHGTLPTGSQRPKVWRQCHAVRAHKAGLKLDKELASIRAAEETEVKEFADMQDKPADD